MKNDLNAISAQNHSLSNATCLYTHKDEKSFKCNICSKSSNYKCNLSKVLYTDTDE